MTFSRFILGFFFSLFSFFVFGQSSGRVCIGKIPESNDEPISLHNANGGARVFDFSVQIDKGDIKKISGNESVLFEDLETNAKHLVIIRNQGKITESFWFDFETYKSNALCLWFKPLYEAWSLWKIEDSAHICNCNTD